jgi:hypothetical protein
MRRSTFILVLHGRNLENGSGKGEGFILKYFAESTFSGTVFEISAGSEAEDRLHPGGPGEAGSKTKVICGSCGVALSEADST